MASAPALPLVSVDEYLNTSYEHDMEYVDGILVERGMPTIAHNLLERILLFWFARFEQDMRFRALHEVRTQIIERARYRIPDIMLCPKPLPTGKFATLSLGWLSRFYLPTTGWPLHVTGSAITPVWVYTN